MHININGLNAKIERLKFYLRTLKYDVVVITESHCKMNYENLIQLKGYNVFLSPTNKSRSAGIVIYAKENLEGKILKNVVLTNILSNI